MNIWAFRCAGTQIIAVTDKVGLQNRPVCWNGLEKEKGKKKIVLQAQRSMSKTRQMIRGREEEEVCVIHFGNGIETSCWRGFEAASM